MGHHVAYGLAASHPIRSIRPAPKEQAMPVTLKKILGMIALVTLVVVYALVATAIATAHLGSSPWWVHMLYFFLTGILWVVPAMFIISWMIRLPSEK